ncbi:MAG TPA: 23S rRNA (uracil(1939)-C(5))-methyltransferase RlmD [Clostridiaceae bacterium]|nr:23S rRNA (uracil(1939)-C(5))-methyltransferase RlmD [Clostridiaceae bacterium]
MVAMDTLFRILIRDVNERGQGVGTVIHEGHDDSVDASDPNDGKVCFVNGALPAEVVTAKLLDDKRHYRVLDLVDIELPSPDRILPDCAYYPECGSCQLRHLHYDAELRLKESRVRHFLSKLQGVHSSKFLPIIGMGDTQYYRGKSIFPFSHEDGVVTLGQYRRGTNDLIDIRHCLVQSEVSLALVNGVRQLANRDKVTAYDRTTRQGALRHLVVRTSFSSRHVMLIFVVNDPSVREPILSWVPALEDAALDAGYTLNSVWMNLQKSRGNRIMSDDYRHLCGEETIEEGINGIRYKLSPDSFFQVNPQQTGKLFSEVIKAANIKPGERVLDLYCGVGAIALQLARYAQGTGEVIGVEIVEAAIDNARDNAKLNGIDNVRFIKADASTWLREQKDTLTIDVIVVDPPRKGLDPTALDVIRDADCERLIYVSCNPATLARDLALLSDRYQIVTIQPVDMFPRTMHVETIVHLTKKKVML